ncbi:MAG: NRDE family protein [Aliidongia sp.]
MCTVILLRRPGHRWPLLLGANRDEMRDRPALAPARHWPDRPEIVAGQDQLAGGSWLGLNDHGVAAAILNRVGTLGPAAGKRSRGELVLDALDYPDAAEAAHALASLDPQAYRPFNLVIADNRDAFWLAHRGQDGLSVQQIPPGLAMLTAREIDDTTSPRIRRYRERFLAAAPPDPDRDDWRGWQALLEDTVPDAALGAESAMRFMLPVGFGTVSSSLIALAEPGAPLGAAWRYSTVAGQPSDWITVDLG